MAICGQCGAEIKPGQQVCSQCGARIHLDEPGNADIMTEEILGIFPGVIVYSLLVSMNSKLVFTTNRLVVAKERRRLKKRTVIWELFKFLIELPIGYSASKLRHPYYMVSSASASERLTMKTESVDAILNENTENFEIPYSAITAVDISPKVKWSRSPIILKVFMGNKMDKPTHRISVMIKHRYYDDFLEILHTVLPGKV